MAHNDRLYRGGPFASATVPTPALVGALDKRAAKSINGDEGGTWEPTAPIIVGGAGITIATAGGFTGGLATGPRAAARALMLGDSDWPTFSAARTRTVLFPLQDVIGASHDYNAAPFYEYSQGVPGAFGQSAQDLEIAAPLDLKKFPIGATIDSVTLRYSVGTRPAAVPILGLLPNIFLKSATLSDDAFPPLPADVDAYFNSGRPQDVQLVPVNNSTVVAGTAYWFLLFEGAHTLNRYHSIAIVFSNILDMAPAL